MMDNLGKCCPRLQNIHVASAKLSHATVLALTAANLRLAQYHLLIPLGFSYIICLCKDWILWSFFLFILTYIKYSWLHLTESAFWYFLSFRGLKMLSLVSGSGITDASVAAIAYSFSKLELLDLSGYASSSFSQAVKGADLCHSRIWCICDLIVNFALTGNILLLTQV